MQSRRISIITPPFPPSECFVNIMLTHKDLYRSFYQGLPATSYLTLCLTSSLCQLVSQLVGLSERNPITHRWGGGFLTPINFTAYEDTEMFNAYFSYLSIHQNKIYFFQKCTPFGPLKSEPSKK